MMAFSVIIFSVILFSLPIDALDVDVIHVHVDDLGSRMLGYKNPQVISPILDEMALGGVRLTNYNAFQVCAPTRASVLTGRYPWRQGAYYCVGDNYGVYPEFKMVPEHLTPHGYATAHIGKWHAGYLRREYTPAARGFNRSMGFYQAGLGDYWIHNGTNFAKNCPNATTDLFNSTGPVLGNARGWNHTYSMAAFTAEASRFVRETPPETPLYLYFATENIHEPINVDMKYVDRYPRVISDAFKVAYGMVTALDDGVASLREEIRRSGRANRTVWIVSSDNGGPLDHTYNIGRGGKHTYWRGGLEVEGFVYAESEDLLPPAVRGHTWGGLSHASDLLPTIVEGIAGYPLQPEPEARYPVDGVNLWPALTSGGPSPRHEVIHSVSNRFYNYSVNMHVSDVITKGGFKLMRVHKGDNRSILVPPLSPHNVSFGLSGGWTQAEDGYPQHALASGSKTPRAYPACVDRPCLYHLASDPDESHDLGGDPQYAGVVQELTGIVDREKDRALPLAAPFTQDEIHGVLEQLCAVAGRTGGFIQPIDFFDGEHTG